MDYSNSVQFMRLMQEVQILKNTKFFTEYTLFNCMRKYYHCIWSLFIFLVGLLSQICLCVTQFIW